MEDRSAPASDIRRLPTLEEVQTLRATLQAQHERWVRHVRALQKDADDRITLLRTLVMSGADQVAVLEVAWREQQAAEQLATSASEEMMRAGSPDKPQQQEPQEENPKTDSESKASEDEAPSPDKGNDKTASPPQDDQSLPAGSSVAASATTATVISAMERAAADAEEAGIYQFLSKTIKQGIAAEFDDKGIELDTIIEEWLHRNASMLDSTAAASIAMTFDAMRKASAVVRIDKSRNPFAPPYEYVSNNMLAKLPGHSLTERTTTLGVQTGRTAVQSGMDPIPPLTNIRSKDDIFVYVELKNNLVVRAEGSPWMNPGASVALRMINDDMPAETVGVVLYTWAFVKDGVLEDGTPKYRVFGRGLRGSFLPRIVFHGMYRYMRSAAFGEIERHFASGLVEPNVIAIANAKALHVGAPVLFVDAALTLDRTVTHLFYHANQRFSVAALMRGLRNVLKGKLILIPTPGSVDLLRNQEDDTA